MTLRSFATGAAIVALCAGAAQAATHHLRHHGATAAKGSVAEPAQPIAYSKLDAYMKASSSQKAHGDWGLDTSTASAATTATGANVSATAPATSSSAAATAATPPAAEATPATPSAPAAEAAPAAPAEAAPATPPQDTTPQAAPAPNPSATTPPPNAGSGR